MQCRVDIVGLAACVIFRAADQEHSGCHVRSQEIVGRAHSTLLGRYPVRSIALVTTCSSNIAIDFCILADLFLLLMPFMAGALADLVTSPIALASSASGALHCSTNCCTDSDTCAMVLCASSRLLEWVDTGEPGFSVWLLPMLVFCFALSCLALNVALKSTENVFFAGNSSPVVHHQTSSSCSCENQSSDSKPSQELGRVKLFILHHLRARKLRQHSATVCKASSCRA